MAESRMRGRPERASLRRRMLAGVLGASLLMGLGTAPTTEQTEAQFLDAEVMTSSFTAFTVPVPVVTSCTVTSLLDTFTGFTIRWTSPYVKAQQRLSINNVVVNDTNIMQSGGGPYTYRATISSGLLGTILGGGLLGATNTVRVQAMLAGTTWISTPATKTLSVGGLLGLGGNNTCT